MTMLIVGISIFQIVNCKYDVVLFRKPRNPEVHHESVYITSSNDLQTPNDHILFDSLGKTVFFKKCKN